MCATDTPIHHNKAARLIQGHAQMVLGECADDAARQQVCVRLARQFSDYAQEFGRRKSSSTLPAMASTTSRMSAEAIDAALDREIKSTAIPRVATEDIDRALGKPEK